MGGADRLECDSPLSCFLYHILQGKSCVELQIYLAIRNNLPTPKARKLMKWSEKNSALESYQIVSVCHRLVCRGGDLHVGF